VHRLINAAILPSRKPDDRCIVDAEEFRIGMSYRVKSSPPTSLLLHVIHRRPANLILRNPDPSSFDGASRRYPRGGATVGSGAAIIQYLRATRCNREARSGLSRFFV
jgi:hypothetical protein